MAQPLHPARRDQWFTDPGVHILELDADAGVRIAELAALLEHELEWASRSEISENRRELQMLMARIWRLLA